MMMQARRPPSQRPAKKALERIIACRKWRPFTAGEKHGAEIVERHVPTQFDIEAMRARRHYFP
jgi:hypothetical protein